MINLKCSTCVNRYGCTEEQEFNCKKKDYEQYSRDESIYLPCIHCVYRSSCYNNYVSRGEETRECETNGFKYFRGEVEEKVKTEPKEEDKKDPDVAHIKWVTREKRVGDRYCPKCGKIVSLGYELIQKIPYCSLCGKRLDDRFMNYCPNCGKKISK